MLIAIRELKSSLSSLLRRAQMGEVFEVTSHNKPIARIIGIPSAAEGLRGLMVSGALAWSGGKPRLSPPLALEGGGRPVCQIVLDDRH